ncbi:angiopoietin-related protein 2-like [Babylonia areolata]|uniref:angiopoietin-related protein 2-like n=1 Tax=Babylonia areolata TaxID=304850 RepID=UPI003FD21D50
MASTSVAVAVLVCFCCVFCIVVADVQLAEGTKPLNYNDARQFKDCGEVLKAGYNVSGPHVLYMNKTAPFLIHCEFDKGVAYNVIQRRLDNNVNFMQTLEVYTLGFGLVQSSYWAGLNVISHLTMTGNKALTINMQDSRGVNKNAMYSHFRVQSYANKFMMTVAGFTGAGLQDDLSYNSGMPFHTYDSPDPNGCAVQMKAGWWYNYCSNTLLNGYYYKPGTYSPSGKYFDGIFWNSFGGDNNSLKFVMMTVQ